MHHFSNQILILFSLLSCVSALASPAIDNEYSKIESKVHKIYKDFHQHPELSEKEFRTSQKMQEYLKSLGYQVTSKIGGTGLVAILENGQGPTVWLRADMDGLPVTEETKLSFKSSNQGVMHACGHDTHLAAMVAYAEILKKFKSSWQGTLVLIVQPAEEIVAGAKAMIEDGLYKKFPKPDYVLGFHVGGDVPAGKLSITKAYALASSDKFSIEVNGEGGHGAAPELAIDPIVLASKIILSTQTIVSRNVGAQDPVVISFGKIQGGTKSNIIPNSVKLEGTLRTYDSQTREKVIGRIKKIVMATAQAEEAPAPTISFSQAVPSTYNTPALVDHLVPTLEKVVGKDGIEFSKGIMGAEDFSYYSQGGKYPSFFYFIGGQPKNTSGYGPNHNSKFAPEYQKVLRVAVNTISDSAIQLFNTKEKIKSEMR